MKHPLLLFFYLEAMHLVYRAASLTQSSTEMLYGRNVSDGCTCHPLCNLQSRCPIQRIVFTKPDHTLNESVGVDELLLSTAPCPPPEQLLVLCSDSVWNQVSDCPVLTKIVQKCFRKYEHYNETNRQHDFLKNDCRIHRCTSLTNFLIKVNILKGTHSKKTTQSNSYITDISMDQSTAPSVSPYVTSGSSVEPAAAIANTKDDDYIPVWVIVLIVLIILFYIAECIVLYYLVIYKKRFDYLFLKKPKAARSYVVNETTGSMILLEEEQKLTSAPPPVKEPEIERFTYANAGAILDENTESEDRAIFGSLYDDWRFMDDSVASTPALIPRHAVHRTE